MTEPHEDTLGSESSIPRSPYLEPYIVGTRKFTNVLVPYSPQNYMGNCSKSDLRITGIGISELSKSQKTCIYAAPEVTLKPPLNQPKYLSISTPTSTSISISPLKEPYVTRPSRFLHSYITSKPLSASCRRILKGASRATLLQRLGFLRFGSGLRAFGKFSVISLGMLLHFYHNIAIRNY